MFIPDFISEFDKETKEYKVGKIGITLKHILVRVEEMKIG